MISKMDDQISQVVSSKFGKKLLYLLDTLQFNGTNVPSPISVVSIGEDDDNDDLLFGYKLISKKVAVNKCIMYTSFAIILAIMTKNLAIQQTDHPTSFYFDELRDVKNTSVHCTCEAVYQTKYM